MEVEELEEPIKKHAKIKKQTKQEKIKIAV